MKPIIVVMLCIQTGILLATVFAIVVRKPTAARPVPVWSSLGYLSSCCRDDFEYYC